MRSKLTFWKILFHIVMLQQNSIKTHQNLHVNVAIVCIENDMLGNVQSRSGFLGEMCVGFKGFFFLRTSPSNCLLFFFPLMVVLHVSSFPVVLLLLVETPFETKLLGLWQMAYIFFWLSFGCSFHHVFLTLLPSN